MTKHEQLIRTAIDQYLAAGGDPEFVIVSQSYFGNILNQCKAELLSQLPVKLKAVLSADGSAIANGYMNGFNAAIDQVTNIVKTEK